MNKMIRGLAAVLVSVSVSLPALAQTAAQHLAQMLSNLQTMQADFEQTVENGQGPGLTSQGKMALQKPGKFRWQTIQPSPQLLIADGNKVWVYDADLQQVTVQRQQAAGNSPAMLLSSTPESLLKAFKISYVQKPAADGRVQFRLVPYQKGQLFQAVELSFVDNSLQHMQVQVSLGQKSQVEFSHVEMNSALSPHLFHFKPPLGVDVIDQSQGF